MNCPYHEAPLFICQTLKNFNERYFYLTSSVIPAHWNTRTKLNLYNYLVTAIISMV